MLGMALGMALALGSPLMATGRTEGSSRSTAGQKLDMVLMIETASTGALMNDQIFPKVKEKFPDVNFILKLRDDAQVEKAVKTAFIGGEAIDIVDFWPHQMRVFTEGNMALDLSSYLNTDTQWRNSWAPGSLEVGNISGKYVAVPYRSTYPLIQVNKAILERAGVTVKEQWTWAEFTDACQKVKALGDANIFPFGINSTWGCWLIRNGILQIFDTEAELERFNRGEIPFTDPRIKQVCDNVKGLYDAKYMYPGDGALTATNDQVLSAFARGRIAMLGNVNGNAGKTVRDTVNGAFEVVTISWPRMGKPEMDHLLGGNEGYFISANTKNPAKTVEVLKYLTSTEILQLWANDGKIVPFQGIKSSDPDYAFYGKDASKVYPVEIVQFSSEINDYIIYNMPANYVLYGEQALKELEELRGTVKR
jgi:ABC-type glycerol-3-phosphate transport system substrate-binding protein